MSSHTETAAAPPARDDTDKDKDKDKDGAVAPPEEERLTARELRKEIRRLQHRGGATGRAADELRALEARYERQAALEKEIMDVKSGITTATKALRDLETRIAAATTTAQGPATTTPPPPPSSAASDLAAAASSQEEEEEASALRSRLTSLKRRYTELTGEAEYRRSKRNAPSRKRTAATQKAEEASLGLAPGPDASTFETWAPREWFRFEVVHESTKSRARVCRLHTPHGVVHTPAFVPVATNGALKCVSSEQAAEADVQLMFCNTYHLLVHPGAETVERAGGLHAFARRDAPIITDSGGFQVFSLADSDSDEDGPELKMKRVRRVTTTKQRGNNDDDDAKDSENSQDSEASHKKQEQQHGQLLAVTERGTRFRSYLDGRVIELTPESSVAAQKRFGADIIIPLDELPPYHVTRERLAASVTLSHRWMARSLRAHLADKRHQAMYAVVHGGVDRDLRRQSVEYLSSLPFDGFAVGGSLGKDKAEMAELLEYVMPLLPRDKPNHLLGIADPDAVETVVPLGVDTMDSCNPTRVARHGTLFTSRGTLRIKGTQYADDCRPIDPDLETDTLPGYTRAYLHHLFKQKEGLALTLASIHNIKYMNHLMATVRERIMRNEI